MITTMHPLNEKQLLAARHVEGPLLIIAGAGSGKTRVVQERIVYLLSLGVPASEILAMTFTNKAAEEMKERIVRSANAHVLVSTFHSLAARILRESIEALGYRKDFVIMDEEDSEKLLRQCFIELGYKEDKSLLRSTKKQISNAKNSLLFPSSLPKEEELIKAVYGLYQKKLKEYNALDFDDLLFLTVILFKEKQEVLSTYQNRWRFILLDEYQDTNEAQYLLVKLLSMHHQNVFAVGDPDQSIYSWRGANIQNILRFSDDYPGAKVIRLEQNYRSSGNILRAANVLIEHNLGRYKKNLWSTKENGEKIRVFIGETERKEAEFVIGQIISFCKEEKLSYNDCAIFYRTNFQSRTFEDALLRENIPYVVIGSLSFYQRKEIKDILAFLRMVVSDTNYIAFARTINLPRRGIGPSTLQRLQELSSETGLPIFQLCLEILSGKLPCKLSTKQRSSLQEYVDLISSLRVLVSKGGSLQEILSQTIKRSQYLQHLQEDKETYEERKDNLEELVAKAHEWEEEFKTPSLAAFLEELALRPGSSEETKEINSVKLMTLHSGKGLEFPLVFLVGMEEDLFPHINARDTADLLEEERRLCYVGITRAKKHLFLTACRYRFLWGSSRSMRPSRFLKELPSDVLLPLSASQESSFAASFSPHDLVFHKEFGQGEILKAYQTSLGETYDVLFFQEQKTRSLVAKYAKLIKTNI